MIVGIAHSFARWCERIPCIKMKFPIAVTPRRLRQLWYVPLLSAAMGLILGRTLVMAKLLDIPSFAQFSGGLLVSSTFTMLGCLGLQSLLQREMPVQIFRRRERASVVLLTQCVTVATACALVGLLLVVAGLHVAGLSSGLLAIGIIHGLSQQLFLIATVESRSRGQPLTFALQTMVRALMVLVVSIAIGVLFKSAVAVLMAEATISLLVTYRILQNVWQPSRLSAALAFRLAIRRIRQIPWPSALALLAVACIGFFLMNIDRWVAVRLLQPIAFANYAFAWTVLMVGQSLQSVINTSIYPMLARRFATAGADASFRFAAVASISLLFVCAITSWPAYWLLNAVVMRWFPTYLGSSNIFGVFIFVASLRLSDFWSSHLVIVGQEKRLLLATFTVGAIVFGGWLSVFAPSARGITSMADVAWLAVALTIVGYLVVFVTACTTRKSY